MTLRERQSKFAHLTAYLILFANQRGYEVTYGDAWAHEEDGRHKANSKHYQRLAVDLNLFRNGKYLMRTEDHRELGEYWESLDPECVWGGRFEDGNHYQYGRR